MRKFIFLKGVEGNLTKDVCEFLEAARKLKVNCIWNLEKGTVEHARTNFPLIFSAQTPALHWQTEYSHDFRGARGRPTTTERYCQDVDCFINYPYIFIVSSRSNNGSLVHFFLSPWDMSWSNLNMWHAQELLPDHLNMTSEPANQSLESKSRVVRLLFPVNHFMI